MTKTDLTKAPATSTAATNVVPLPATQAEPRPSEKIISFVKRHPVIMVAGAVTAGIVVSAIIPRKKSRKLLSKAISLAEAAGATTIVFGREAGHQAHRFGDSAIKQATRLGHQAEHVGHEAAQRIEKYGLAAYGAATAMGKSTAHKTEKLSDAAADRAAHIGDIAGERSAKVKEMVKNFAQRHR